MLVFGCTVLDSRLRGNDGWGGDGGNDGIEVAGMAVEKGVAVARGNCHASIPGIMARKYCQLAWLCYPFRRFRFTITGAGAA